MPDAAGSPSARIAQGRLALVAGDLETADTVLRGAVSAARVLGNAFTLATALNVHATLTERSATSRRPPSSSASRSRCRSAPG